MAYDIIMRDVTFAYAGSRKPALAEIDLKIKSGEKVLISGHAGAGKSTLCYCMNGLVPHFFPGELTGEILVSDLETRRRSISALSQIVGLLFDNPVSQLLCPTVEDEVAFGPENYGLLPEEIRSRVKRYISSVRLEGYEARNPYTLSGGEQQECAVAAVLAMEPKVLVLDEPTSRLDPLGTSQVLYTIFELTSQKGHTLIIVENKVEDILPLVDRFIVMKEGKIAFDGKPSEALDMAETVTKAGIRLPQVSELFHMLRNRGHKVSKIPISLEEALTELESLFHRRRLQKTRPKRLQKTRPLGIRQESVIKVEDLWYVYPLSTTALKGISLTITEGENVAIIGQNGSGKSTLVKHFVGLLKPTRGKVLVYGMDVTNSTPSDLARYVGLCFQNPEHQLFAPTVRKELEFGPQNLSVPREEIESRIEHALTSVGLDQNILSQSPHDMSLAEKQRIAIASILTMKPKIFVIDEPTTGQDPHSRREIMKLLMKLNEEGMTIIVITHDLQLVAEYMDRSIVLRDGKVLLDAPTSVAFSHSETLRETSLQPPQITRIGQLLKNYGLPEDVLTVDEMYRFIDAKLRG